MQSSCHWKAENPSFPMTPGLCDLVDHSVHLEVRGLCQTLWARLYKGHSTKALQVEFCSTIHFPFLIGGLPWSDETTCFTFANMAKLSGGGLNLNTTQNCEFLLKSCTHVVGHPREVDMYRRQQRSSDDAREEEWDILGAWETVGDCEFLDKNYCAQIVTQSCGETESVLKMALQHSFSNHSTLFYMGITANFAIVPTGTCSDLPVTENCS